MNIKQYLTRRNIVGFIIFLVLLIAIPVTVQLIRQQQILKSEAASAPVTFSGTGVTQTGNTFTTTNRNVTVDLRAPDPNGSDW